MAKTVLRRNYIVMSAHFRKSERSEIHNLYFKHLDKQKQAIPKVADVKKFKN
jgi:hypothetical protein